MSCPRDNSQLVRFSATPPSVGVCRTCHGMWIPHDVLEDYAKQLKLIFSDEKLDAKLAELDDGADVACPDGHGPMVTYNYHGVEIDICPQCHGVWLDHGELAIIQRLKHQGTQHDSKFQNDGASFDGTVDSTSISDTFSSFIEEAETRLAGADPDLPGEGIVEGLDSMGDAAAAAGELAVEAMAFVLEALFSSA